jgi:hypothetical protein
VGFMRTGKKTYGGRRRSVFMGPRALGPRQSTTPIMSASIMAPRAPKRSPFVGWAAGSPPRRPDRPPANPHAGPKGGLNRSDPNTLTAGARIAPCGRDGG